MTTKTSINGMNRDEMIADLKKRGAKTLVPKGVSEPMVRWIARDHEYNDVAAGMCFIEDFAVINSALMKVD
jgi:hypothetical protein